MHILQTKLKLDAEEKDRFNFLNLAQTYKNEKINEDNLADNARIKIEIYNVFFSKQSKRYGNIFIKMIYGSDVKQTTVLNDPMNLVWNEQFELYGFLNLAKLTI